MIYFLFHSNFAVIYIFFIIVILLLLLFIILLLLIITVRLVLFLYKILNNYISFYYILFNYFMHVYNKEKNRANLFQLFADIVSRPFHAVCNLQRIDLQSPLRRVTHCQTDSTRTIFFITS